MGGVRIAQYRCKNWRAFLTDKGGVRLTPMTVALGPMMNAWCAFLEDCHATSVHNVSICDAASTASPPRER